jgi:prepilin-type N-terminal cleavage/methylation domain-containing protein
MNMNKLRPIFKAPGRLRGFTLIEMLIGLVIMSILMGALLSLYSKGQQQFMNQNIQSDVLEKSRYPLAWIGRDVKSAAQVAATWGSYTTSSNTLVLTVPSVDSGGLIINVNSEFDYVIYRVINRKLQRIYDAKEGVSARVDGSRNLADDITGLSITYYDASDATLSSNFATAASVRVSLSTARKGFRRTFQESLNSKFKLRNK